MKTFLERSWRHRANEFVLPDIEKQCIRQSYLDAVTRCVGEKKLRAQYEDLLYKLAALDYPAQWPDLLPSIV